MTSRTTTSAATVILALGPFAPPAAFAYDSTPVVVQAQSFAPIHDTRVDSSSPTSNFGGSSQLRIRGGGGALVHSFLKFTVAGLAGPIDSARVRLYCVDASLDGGRIHPVSNDYLATTTPWIESGLTYNNAPAVTGPILDQNGEVLIDTWVEFDVTSAIVGDSTYSFALTSNSTNIAGFGSKETSNPPQLVIWVRAAPVIASFLPASGPAGTEVTIDGVELGGATALAFNGVPASFVIDSETRIRAVVPAGAASGPIAITNVWGTGLSNTDFLLPTPLPEAAFTPLHDARVDAATPTVNFGAHSLLRVRSGTPIHSLLKFNVSGLVSSIASAKLRLFCVDESADGGRLHTVSPNYGDAASPWIESAVTWNNAPPVSGPILDQAGPATLNAWVDLDVGSVVTGNGSYSFGLASDLTNIAGYSSKEGIRPPRLVIQQRLPAITGFTPGTSPIGAQITVTGTDLNSVTQVAFNGAPATFTIDSPTQLRATVPAGASTGPIRLTSPIGTVFSSTSLTVVQPPTLIGFSPTHAPIGAQVTISGTGLALVTAVDFYGTPATFVIDSDVQLRATVPAGAASGRIHVTNPAGNATSSAAFAVDLPPAAKFGLWSSAEELATKPMSGVPWEQLLAAADTADQDTATIIDQDGNHNITTLAAGLVFARTGIMYYRDVVVDACETLVAGGRPTGRTLPWARELGAYVLAADLVGYRTAEFEFWLRNMAEVWEGEDDRHLLEAFGDRPNNWGANAFGTLAAIYGYLGDDVRLVQIRDYWIQSVNGPNPGQVYADDLSWHADSLIPRSINPAGTRINGFIVDGLIPDDMQRGGPFQLPPVPTLYPWEHMQGLVMAARIFERLGMPIWGVGDDAIFRAAFALEIHLESEFGDWKAKADDLWMLPFIDDAYGTDWSDEVPDQRLWQAGKNCGWAYVIWNPTLLDADPPSVAGVAELELGPVVPSPVRGSGAVEFRLSRSEAVDLRLVDVTGRTTRVLAQGVYPAGRHRVDLSARGLVSGMYLLRLAAGGTVKSTKVPIIQ
jgi:IPT/TIG domain